MMESETSCSLSTVAVAVIGCRCGHECFPLLGSKFNCPVNSSVDIHIISGGRR